MFIAQCVNTYGDSFTANGDTLQEAYDRLCSYAQEIVAPDSIDWFRAEPIDVEIAFTIVS